MCSLRSVSCMREKRRAERGKPYGYTPPAGNPPRAARTSLVPRTPSSPIHKKHHIMISPSSPPISSHPILVNPKRTLSQTQPRCSHILTTPRDGLTLFLPTQRQTPLVQHFCQPLSPAQSVRTFRPERSIHSEPLKVSLSPSRVFPSSPALSTTPPHFAAPPLQHRTHPDGPPSGRQ